MKSKQTGDEMVGCWIDASKATVEMETVSAVGEIWGYPYFAELQLFN